MLRLFIFISFCIAPYCTQADTSTPKKITYTDTLILGLVQGITEFLPISSTGHLIISNHALGLTEQTPIKKSTGETLLKKDGVTPYSLNDAANAYSIIIQGGTILAIVIIYWRRIISILRGIIGQSSQGRLCARNILIAFAPSIAAGLLLEDWIDNYLFHPKTVIFALIAGAILILVTEKYHKKSKNNHTDIQDLTPKQSLAIGLMQCVAMWPGTSRSMMTLLGGYLVGLPPIKAAEFSFLLGLVTLCSASIYKTYTQGAYLVEVLSIGPTLFGCLIAFISGAFAVKWLISYISSHSLKIFAWYRICMGASLYLLLYFF